MISKKQMTSKNMNNIFGPFNQPNIFATTDGPGFPHNASNSSNKAPDSTMWKVLMYQIPVPLGDCSIYVLLESNVIKNCFIMDGGTNSGDVNAATQIKTALTAIEDELRGNHSSRTAKTKQAPRLKFDSWVVTHWDEDHWKGVADLIKGDGDNENGKGLKCYFKDKPSLIAGATCDADLGGKEDGTPTDSDHSNGQDGLKELGFELNDDYVGQHLIGRDLFQPEDKGTPNILGRLTWKGDENRPRFVCLGAGGYGFGEKKAFKPKPSRNETSILSLLYWPSTNRGSYWTGGDGFPKLTKDLANTFFEKSGLFDQPIKVVKLDHHGSSREFSNVANTSRISKTFLAKPFFTMTVKANPSRIIVTPGNKYGHPCWDVILFLYCWDRDRKATAAANFVAPANKGSSKNSKAADKPDRSLENVKVPNCAGLVYTTRTPYWIASPRVGDDDVNTTAGRGRLADKMVEDYLWEDKNVTMLELYRKHGLDSHGLDWERDPATDPKDKRSKIDKMLEPKHVVDDGEDIEQESRDNLADMTCEWWNWLSRQHVQRPQSGVANGDRFYMLKMTSVMDEVTDGEIEVLTPEGEPDPLTRPVLKPRFGRTTRGKSAEVKEWWEIEEDPSSESDGTNEVRKKKVSTQAYEKLDPGITRQAIQKFYESYTGPMPLASHLGDKGKAMRGLMELIKKGEAMATEEENEEEEEEDGIDLEDHDDDGKLNIHHANNKSKGGEEYVNKNGEEDDEQHVKKKGGGRYGKSNIGKRPGNDKFDQYENNDLGTKTKKEVTSKKGTLDSSKEKKQGGKSNLSKLELKKLKKKKGGSEENPKQNIKLKKLKN